MKARGILLTQDACSISVALAFGREGEQMLGSLEFHLCGGRTPVTGVDSRRLQSWEASFGSSRCTL